MRSVLHVLLMALAVSAVPNAAGRATDRERTAPPGALAVVRIAVARHAFGCFDRAGLDRAVAAIARRDGETFEMLFESGACVLVPNGERGQPQVVGPEPGQTRMQMVSGQWIGRRLWFDSNWLTATSPVSDFERSLVPDRTVSALAAASGQTPVCRTAEGLASLAALLDSGAPDAEAAILERAGCRLLPNGTAVTRSARPAGTTPAVRVTILSDGSEGWTTADMVVDFGPSAAGG